MKADEKDHEITNLKSKVHWLTCDNQKSKE